MAGRELRQARRPDGADVTSRARDLVFWAMQPERWWLAVLAASLLISVPQGKMVFGHWSLPGCDLFREAPGTTFDIGSVLSTAWQVLAGTLGMTFVIAVFLIEFASSRRHERSAFSLFAAYTGLIFIVIFGLTTLVSMGVNLLLLGNPGVPQDGLPSATEYNLLLFVLNILLAGFLCIRTYRFVQPRFLRQVFLRDLKARISRKLDTELRRRIGYHLLVRSCHEHGIRFSPWRPARRLGTIPVRLCIPAFATLEVVDVNLGLLRLAASRARRLTASEGESGVVFFAPLGMRVSQQRAEVAFVPAAANYSRVTSLLKRSVRVAPLGLAGGGDERESLQLNRDLISDAIRAGRSDVAETLLDQYVEALRFLLVALARYDVHLLAGGVGHYEGSFQDWELVTEVQRHYLGLVEQALDGPDPGIVRLFVGFPLQVMALAHRHQNLPLFRRFAGSFPRLYRAAARGIADPARREYVYDRCWRFLVEFFDFYINLTLEYRESPEAELQAQGDYAEYLILVLNGLLKAAVDLRDLRRFQAFATAARRIPTPPAGSAADELDTLRAEAELRSDGSLDPTLDEQIRKKTIVVEQLARAQAARQVAFMGLGGWLAHLFESELMPRDEFLQFAQILAAELTDIGEMYSLYAGVVTSRDIGSVFGWDTWEMEELEEARGDTGFTFLKNSAWLETYYVFRALELSSSDIDSIPTLQPNVASGQLYRAVSRRLDTVSASPIWRSVLVDPDRHQLERRSDALREMHRRSAEKQKVIEEDDLIRQPLDAGVVEGFISEVEKRWLGAATVRRLVGLYGRYEERFSGTVPEGLLPFGKSRIEPKGAFVRGGEAAYVDWPGSHARAQASGEDAVLSAALGSIPTIEVGVDQFEPLIVEALQDLRGEGANPVVFFSGLMPYRALLECSQFRLRWKVEIPISAIAAVEGTLDDALVVNLGLSMEKDTVTVVDLNRFGVLVQYAVDQGDESPLSISVEEISPERADRLLEDQPGLARDPDTGQTLEHGAARRRLQQRVVVDIWERCQFEDIDPSAGRRFRFRPGPS